MEREALLRELEMNVDSDEAFERASELLELAFAQLPPEGGMGEQPLRFAAVGLLGRLMDYATGEYHLRLSASREA